MFPSWYLLIPYGLFVLLATLFLFFNIFHVIKFGLQSTQTTVVLASYVFFYIAGVIFTLVILINYEWNAMIDIAELFDVSSGTTLPL